MPCDGSLFIVVLHHNKIWNPNTNLSIIYVTENYQQEYILSSYNM